VQIVIEKRENVAPTGSVKCSDREVDDSSNVLICEKEKKVAGYQSLAVR
jgi:hypothetical protein